MSEIYKAMNMDKIMKIESQLMRALFALIISVLSFCFVANSVSAEEKLLSVELEIPKIDADPYHRPYVAVWVETLERQPVATLAVWHEKDTWLKDLRQWWRKIGRRGTEKLDNVTGATRRPDTYTVTWNGVDNSGKKISSGEFLINIESVREEGGRSYTREKITLGAQNSIEVAPDLELGKLIIKTF